MTERAPCLCGLVSHDNVYVVHYADGNGCYESHFDKDTPGDDHGIALVREEPEPKEP